LKTELQFPFPPNSKIPNVFSHHKPFSFFPSANLLSSLHQIDSRLLLIAALAVWQYCEDSARFIFGDAMGDATADETLRELRSHREGMTRNEIREHFQRHKPWEEIRRALCVLQEYGLATPVRERGDQGRPAERWQVLSAVRGKRGMRGN
jgi:hypothetical protein